MKDLLFLPTRCLCDGRKFPTLLPVAGIFLLYYILQELCSRVTEVDELRYRQSAREEQTVRQRQPFSRRHFLTGGAACWLSACAGVARAGRGCAQPVADGGFWVGA